MMKATIKVEKEVEIKYLIMQVAVRYDEEDMPKDYPGRKGDLWTADIDIDTGKINGFPSGHALDLYMKVCDQGCYALLDENRIPVLQIDDDYVPNNLVPGEYGDYIDLKIDDSGLITNWPKNPSIVDFITDED